MNLLKKIRDYLSQNPLKKAKDVANNLGCNRKTVNSVLYQNTELFKKNNQHEWSLGSLQISEQDIGYMNPKAYKPETTVIVEDIDLVERIKDLLKIHLSLNVSAIAEKLEEPSQIVKLTLRAYTEVFENTDVDEWVIRDDYEVITTGLDAEFDDIEPKTEQIKNLPLADFEEKDKPPQRAVIEARLDRNFLVLAPPGTGKTHTLIERLVYAITKSNQDVDPGKLLVLSFTRAAVGEVRERIARAIANGAPPRLRYVRVMTFDAYTTWILNDGSYDITNKGFDARIRLLTTELQQVSLRQATERIARSRYLFVDEIQDLVGVRADMVFELIKRILTVHGSVTLFGDPHQSLNDYQIKGNQTGSAVFLEKVQNYLRGGLEKFELEVSHRYETPEMKALTTKAKQVLDNFELSAKDKFTALVELIPKATMEELIDRFNTGSVDALLCRSNREVFQWLNWHHEQGNECTVNTGADGCAWPAWIGQALMSYHPDVITCEQLISRVHSIVDNQLVPSDAELHEFLLNEKLVRHNTINLEDLAFRMKYLSPAKAGGNSDTGLIVSTVHKAKGLEYKNVVLVEPNQWNVSAELVRILYVAITRAKRSISLLPINSAPFSSEMKKRKGGHLGYTENGVKYNQVTGLEDFDFETLFIDSEGGVDTVNLKNYQHFYQVCQHFCIRPESCNAENDHNYALYLNSNPVPVRLCAVSNDLKISLDAMAWGNNYSEDGAMLDMGDSCGYQTIVHPMESHTLTRHIGPAGIIVFPLIQGFYTLSRATGE